MRLPHQATAIIRQASQAPLARPLASMSGCSALQWIECAAAVAACATSCLAGPEVCAECFAEEGLPSCIQCV